MTISMNPNHIPFKRRFISWFHLSIIWQWIHIFHDEKKKPQSIRLRFCQPICYCQHLSTWYYCILMCILWVRCALARQMANVFFRVTNVYSHCVCTAVAEKWMVWEKWREQKASRIFLSFRVYVFLSSSFFSSTFYLAFKAVSCSLFVRVFRNR